MVSAGLTHARCNVQVCPYDCRHTLATVSSYAALATQNSLQDNLQQPLQQTHQPEQLQPQQQQATSQAQQMQQLQRQAQQQLHLYVYESEPEVLARHLLLLAVLFDAALPVRVRAELFLELHGNAVLRQKSADYLGAQVSALLTIATAVSLLPACIASLAATRHRR